MTGRVARAAGGTLLLEEVGALDAATQAIVLAALDGPARVIASSTRELGALVAEDRFRADLLARLSECTVVIPPLRARLEDLPALVEHHLATHRRAIGGTTPTITAAALERLGAHQWPGDVGELETVLDHALALGHGDPIEAEDLQLGDHPLDESELPAERSYFKASVAALERDLITTALRDAGGNRSRAAELLGIYRRLLYAKIKEYGLEGHSRKQR
ncbi:MAG: sigma-54-dependent Fis family transcriptional regulator [Chloroflexi bacterium]|nr:sigma-54-dependent Fis family transcriptional regulator [Chloroflexota bacterium]